MEFSIIADKADDSYQNGKTGRSLSIFRRGVYMVYWVIGIAGAVGALLRYYLGILLPASSSGGFPFGTLIINYIGCFFLSWFTIWSTEIVRVPQWVRVGVATGLIGSFTTFSTFSVEVVTLFRSGSWIMALVYTLLSLWGGLFLTWSGYQLATKQKQKELEMEST